MRVPAPAPPFIANTSPSASLPAKLGLEVVAEDEEPPNWKAIVSATRAARRTSLWCGGVEVWRCGGI